MHDTAEMFITDNHKVADTCHCGSLKKLIPERIVVGPSDKQPSERLQLDTESIASRQTDKVCSSGLKILPSSDACRQDVTIKIQVQCVNFS